MVFVPYRLFYYFPVFMSINTQYYFAQFAVYFCLLKHCNRYALPPPYNMLAIGNIYPSHSLVFSAIKASMIRKPYKKRYDSQVSVIISFSVGALLFCQKRRLRVFYSRSLLFGYLIYKLYFLFFIFQCSVEEFCDFFFRLFVDKCYYYCTNHTCDKSREQLIDSCRI